MINFKKPLTNLNESTKALLSTCAKRLDVEIVEIELPVMLDRPVHHLSHLTMIQENLTEEESTERETIAEVDAENTVIMTTIAIEEEQDIMSEGINTTTMSTIQTQCPPRHLVPITRGVETTHLVQDATFTMSMASVIVDMIVTADIPDPETWTAGTITGTTL